MIRTRAVTGDPRVQTKLDRAIEKAVRQPQRQSFVPLCDLAGKRYLFQIVPALGRARDVFFATSAIGVLIGRPRLAASTLDMGMVRELFGLTTRETQIVGFLFEGRSTVAIATKISIVPETVRFHLKSIFEKTGTHSRVEVVAILAHLVR